MEIRPIKPEERILLSKIQCIAFLFTRDFSDSEQNPEKFYKSYETGRAAFDETGKMCSGLELIPYNVRFDGSTVQMGGIGGVVSLPEVRRRGYVRKLFEYCMEEMYEQGYVFSYLYPFSHEYYRKFGYELNLTNTEYTIPFSAFSSFKTAGTVQMFVPGMDASDIISVYNQYIQDKNLSVVREHKHWERFMDKDPYKTNVFLYVWYNDEGQPRGYFQYSVDRSDKTRLEPDMKVDEMVFLDGEAFKGMMAFLNQLASRFHNLILRLPHFENILPFFPEPYNVEQKIRTQGMNRIVNVQRALELMRVPAGRGEAVIEVKDYFYERNSGRYLIQWENGTSSVAATGREPDLVCGVNHLSQLVTGFLTLPQLCAAGCIEVAGDISKLSNLFVHKQLFLGDYF